VGGQELPTPHTPLHTIMPICIIVHGGAWEIPDALVERHERGCRAAAETGYALLRAGASAMDAVEAAVRSLEDDTVFDAGRGSFLNRDGVVELDAGLMDGSTLASAAVAAVIGVANPVTLARRMLERTSDRLVVGAGASALARELGVDIVDPETLATPEMREFWESTHEEDPQAIFDRTLRQLPQLPQSPRSPRSRGTVGAVALDAAGGLVAATSTGGSPGKRPGRVGDSPLVGSGFFADSGVGGASSTGQGEAIVTVGLARLAVDLLRAGRTPGDAARAAVDALATPRVDGVGGVILMNSTGEAGAAFNTSRMARAWINGDGILTSGVDRT
jgi:beta-aspartyl-peptidase (threonine type)